MKIHIKRENARISRARGNVRDEHLSYLSALEHFKYKYKPELASELQIVTAYQSVVSHQVVGDDEWFILAGNGKNSGITGIFMSNLQTAGSWVSR